MKEKAKKALLRASGAVMLREFAKALVEMKTAEINDLAAVLKEEYGIVPAKLEIKEAAENVSITKSPKQVLKKQQSRDYFVPRKMGKVCSKPKKRF
jgi:hypothetical protein